MLSFVRSSEIECLAGMDVEIIDKALFYAFLNKLQAAIYIMATSSLSQTHLNTLNMHMCHV